MEVGRPGTLWTLWTVCPYNNPIHCTARVCVHMLTTTHQDRLLPTQRKLLFPLQFLYSLKHSRFTANKNWPCDQERCNCRYSMCMLLWNLEQPELLVVPHSGTTGGEDASFVKHQHYRLGWQKQKQNKKNKECDIHSDCCTPVTCFFFVYEHGAETRWHRGQSHRKLRRQKTSHPAWALEETLPPWKQRVLISHMKAVVRCWGTRYYTVWWNLKSNMADVSVLKKQNAITMIFGGKLHSQNVQVNKRKLQSDMISLRPSFHHRHSSTTIKISTQELYTLVMAISWPWGPKDCLPTCIFCSLLLWCYWERL